MGGGVLQRIRKAVVINFTRLAVAQNSNSIQLRSVNDGFETQLRSMNVESSVQPYRQADAGGHMSSLSDSLPFSLLLHNGKGAAVIIILT